jgi:hypothetical protein
MATTRLTWRDGAATVFVAALMVVYAEFLGRGGLGFIADPRGMASVGLISSVVLCPLGSAGQTSGPWARITGLAGCVTLALGVAAVVTVSWGVLAAFMIAIATMWALATLHHALGTAPRHSQRVGAVNA